MLSGLSGAARLSRRTVVHARSRLPSAIPGAHPAGAGCSGAQGLGRAGNAPGWLVLAVLCAGMLMVVLDTTAVNLAVLASLATSHANQLRRAGDPPLRALASGYRLAAAAGAGLVLAALAVTCVLLILTRRQRLVTAHQHPDRKIRTLHPPASSQ